MEGVRRDEADDSTLMQQQKEQAEGRNCLVVANHQWLVNELTQIIELVAGFRRKLRECAAAKRSADTGQ